MGDILVKKGEVKSKDGKEWVELIDVEDQLHRIFPSAQDGKGEWHHLEDDIAMLKGKIEDGSIEGLALRLTKIQKGKWWNTIKCELIKDMFEKKALEKVEASQANTRDRSFALAYAKDLAVASKIEVAEILKIAEGFADWLGGAKITMVEKPVTPEASESPKVEAEERTGYMTTVEMITLEQRKRIDELKSQFGYGDDDVAKLVKSQKGWTATSVKGLTKAQGDKLIALMDIGATAEQVEEEGAPEEFYK